jgi:hypothetical protein
VRDDNSPPQNVTAREAIGGNAGTVHSDFRDALTPKTIATYTAGAPSQAHITTHSAELQLPMTNLAVTFSHHLPTQKLLSELCRDLHALVGTRYL